MLMRRPPVMQVGHQLIATPPWGVDAAMVCPPLEPVEHVWMSLLWLKRYNSPEPTE